MPAFLKVDDEFVRHVCRLVAADPYVDAPRSEAIRVCQYLTGVRPGRATALVNEYLAPDEPTDVLVPLAEFAPACMALGEIREARLMADGWRILTLRRDRKALEAAGVGFSHA